MLLVAFGMDQEIPEYDMDSEDEQWLNRQVKHLKMDVSSLKFESMMDRLEKGSGQMVCISASTSVVFVLYWCSPLSVVALCWARLLLGWLPVCDGMLVNYIGI